jgi:hypothetical protein
MTFHFHSILKIKLIYCIVLLGVALKYYSFFINFYVLFFIIICIGNNFGARNENCLKPSLKMRLIVLYYFAVQVKLYHIDTFKVFKIGLN